MRQIQAASQKRCHLPVDPLGTSGRITDADRALCAIAVLNAFHRPPKKRGENLSVEVKRYLAEASRRGASPLGLSRHAHCLRLLVLATKDARVEKIKAKHLKKFWKVFGYWPKHAGLRKDLQGKTDKQILAVGKKEGAKASSAVATEFAKRIIQAFFNWFVERRVILISPMHCLH